MSTSKSDERLAGAFGAFGGIVGVLTFLGCWIYAIATYGLFLGLGLGWIPSVVIAIMAGLLSPLLLLGALALFALYLANNPDAAIGGAIVAGSIAVPAAIAWVVFDKLPALVRRRRERSSADAPTAER